MEKLNQHIDDIITGKADEKRDGSDILHELVGCPFCDAQTRKIDGDYLVKHKPDCFLAISSNGLKETWIVGKRAKEAWQNRTPNDKAQPPCG